MAALAAQAIDRAPDLPEWIDSSQVNKEGWPTWRDALVLAHKGENAPARDRLAYDELLANSLALMLVRADNRKRKGQPLQGNGTYRGKLALPFPLTGAQRRSIAEIEGDMAQEAPMLRLLQGDVGELTVVGDFDEEPTVAAVRKMTEQWKSETEFEWVPREAANLTEGSFKKLRFDL